MAFELLLRTGGNDKVSHLRRQEAPQPAHAFDFAHLVSDAVFRNAGLASPPLLFSPQFFQKSRVLDGDDGLSGEVREQADLLVIKWPNLLAVYDDCADHVVPEHRNAHRRWIEHQRTGRLDRETDQPLRLP